MAKKIKKDEIDDIEVAETQFFGSREDHPEDRTISSRNRVREQLNSQIEAFLSSGGKINEIDPHITADPPQKPKSSYGSRPI